MNSTEINVGMVTAGCSLLALYTFLIARRSRKSNWPKAVYSSISSWKTAQHPDDCEGDPGSDFNVNFVSKVKNMAEQQQRDFTERLVRVGGPISAVLTVFMLTNQLRKVDQKVIDEGGLSLAAGHTTLLFLALFSAVLSEVYPKALGKCFRTSLHVLGHLSLAKTVLMYTHPLPIIWDGKITLITRLLMLIVFAGNTCTSVCLNVLYAALECVQYAKLASHHPKEPTWSQLTLGFVIQEALVMVTLMAIIFAWEAYKKVESKTMLRGSAAGAFQCAVKELLNRIYDVVMDLDHDMRISGDALSLSGLLLHESKSLKGCKLVDYMWGEEDRERFLRHVTPGDPKLHGKSQSSVTTPVPVHLKMRDSAGTAVHVEVLHSIFQDLDSQNHFLIGLREVEVVEDYIMEDPPTGTHADSALEQHSELAWKLRSRERFPDGEPHSITKETQGIDWDSVLADSPKSKKKRRRPVAGHGTSVAASDEHLSDAESVRSETLSLRSGSSGFEPSLAVPWLRETDKKILRRSILKPLSHWNLTADRPWCCTRHAAMFKAMEILRAERKRGCVHHVQHGKSRYKFQCDWCSMIAHSASDIRFGKNGCIYCSTQDEQDDSEAECEEILSKIKYDLARNHVVNNCQEPSPDSMQILSL